VTDTVAARLVEQMDLTARNEWHRNGRRAEYASRVHTIAVQLSTMADLVGLVDRDVAQDLRDLAAAAHRTADRLRGEVAS